MRSIASRRMVQRASPDWRALERSLVRLGTGPSRPLRGASGRGKNRDERAGHPVAGRAAHLGFARPPDHRSGNHAQRRRDGARRCAGRRLARLSRGDRQARWRQALRRSRRAGCACRDHRRNRARADRARPVRPGRDRRQAHRPRRDAEQGEARRKRADRRFARRSSCRGRKPRPAALAPSLGRRDRRSFRCPRSRSLAAARMRDGEPTSRISWSSRRAPKASPRRWK